MTAAAPGAGRFVSTRKITSLYWYCAVPCLVLMGLWTLRNLDRAISLDRAAYVIPDSKKVLPGFHNNRDPKFGVPLPNSETVRIQDNQNDERSVLNPTKMQSKNWWNSVQQQQQQLQQQQQQQLLLQKRGEMPTTRVSHPNFVEKLKQSQRDLEAKTLPSIVPQPSTWNLAPTNVSFGECFLPPPRLPETSDSVVDVVILVLSAHQNFEQRQAIRETWADGIIYFVVGHSNCTTTTECLQEDHNLLLKEQLLYQDLVEIPIIESYRRLPEKVIQAYHWTLQHIPSVQWLVKADDDTFLRPLSLQRYLRKYNSNIPIWIGKMIPHSPVARSGKWADFAFPADFYPYWAIGSAGHIVSRTIAQYVVMHSATLYRYQGEDVSLGIWLDQWKEEVTYIQAERMITNDGIGVCGIPRYLMIGHDLTLDEIYECHLRFANTSVLNENTWHEIPAGFEELVQLEEGSIVRRNNIGTPLDSKEDTPDSWMDGDAKSPWVDTYSQVGYEKVVKGRAIGYSFPTSLRDHMAKKQ